MRDDTRHTREENAISTHRLPCCRTSIPTSQVLLYLLVACGWQYHATPQPHLDDKSAGTLNMALRFANTTWWWAILAFFQFIWRYYVSEVRHNDGVWRAYGLGGRLHHQEK